MHCVINRVWDWWWGKWRTCVLAYFWRCSLHWNWENYQHKSVGLLTDGSGPGSCQISFSGGALRDGSGEAMAERLAATCLHQCHPEKNCAKKRSERISEEELCAWRRTGTFQTRLHKFWVWQLISSSQSTCPDIRSCRTYSSTLGLTTLPRIYLSLSYPPDLFDLYLFIAIAAAAWATHACQ